MYKRQDENSSLVGNIEALFSSVVFLATVYLLTQTALATIGAFFYNLVSDLVGGIEVVVLEVGSLGNKVGYAKKTFSPALSVPHPLDMITVDGLKISFIVLPLGSKPLLTGLILSIFDILSSTINAYHPPDEVYY